MVQKLYLKGEPCAHSCRIAFSYIVNQFAVLGLHEFLHCVDRCGYEMPNPIIIIKLWYPRKGTVCDAHGP